MVAMASGGVLEAGEKIAADLVPLIIPIDSVREHPRNPNEGDDEGIAGSLGEHSQYKPIVVQASTRFILAGNHTWKGAKRRGWRYVAAVVLEVGDSEALKILAGDNQWSKRSRWKEPELAGIIEELERQNNTANMGFDQADLDALMGRLKTEQASPAPPDGGRRDVAPRVKEDAVSGRGDIWSIGEHRVMCGDARDAGDVERLFQTHGEDAAVAITSPPYADRRSYDETSEFAPIAPEEYGNWFRPLAAHVMAHLDPKGSFFLNIKPHSEEGQRSLYVTDLLLQLVRQAGWRFVDEFCWRNARNGVPGTWPDRFKNAWEPVYHLALNKGFNFYPQAVAVKSEQAFSYSPNNSNSASGSGIGIGSYKATGLQAGMALPSNVIEAASESQQGGHPAPFPVKIPAFFVAAFTKPGDIVYDPCGGGGATLVAAHQGPDGPRRALLMEISPRYCDLIIRRAGRLLGVDPIRDDGTPWSALAPALTDDDDADGEDEEDDGEEPAGEDRDDPDRLWEEEREERA